MIGVTIDQYRITERLGGGGMGDVYRATDLELDREVAIKCVRADLSDIGDVTRRFRTEARTLARLSHPNIATVFRFFSQDAQLFLVMEFIPGTHFGSMLRKGGPMAPTQASALMGQALQGLGYAHRQKVVHRDLKPGNLMVDAEGTVKVLDFGIAHVLDSTRMTRTGGIVGTPAYMAPEQALGQAVDHRTDLYSLGIVLYEMLTGSLPFEANSDFELMRAHVEVRPRPLSELSSSVPVRLQDTVSRALAKDTAERFQSAEEFAEALRAPSGDTTVAVSRRDLPPVAAAGDGSAATVPTERRRSYVWPALIGVAALLLLGAGIWRFAGPGTAPNPAGGAGVTTSAPAAAATPQDAEPVAAGTAADASPAATDGAGTPAALVPEPADAGGAEPPAETRTPAQAAQQAPAKPVRSQPAATVTSQPSTARPPATAPAPAATAPARTVPSPTPAAAAVASPSVRVLKISVHKRQGTGRFSRAAGYNGDFRLTVPGSDRGGLQIDEMLEVSRNGQQVLNERVASRFHKPGVFQSKERVPALKQLEPGVYDVRLVFVAGGKPLGHHDWKLEVVD